MHLRRPLPSSGITVYLLVVAALCVVGRKALATASSQKRSGSQYHEVAEESSGTFQFAGRLGPVEEALFWDALDGQWNQHSLLTAALVASGLDEPEAVRRYEVRFDELVVQLDRSLAKGLPEKAKAEAIFDFLHRRILTRGYQSNCTDLTHAFDEGRFNCVSASVLFNCLASRFGLVAHAVEVPGHAMSRLVFEDGRLDVETTCPSWFRLADDPKKQAELAERRLGFCPTDRWQKGDLREVSEIEFVATIYYNRGIDLLGEKHFAEALAANAKAVRLDPGNATARGNLLATLNNWAIDLGSAGHFAEAARLLKQGIQIDPDYDVFKGNHVHVYLQWAESLCQEGNYQMAVRLLAAASREQPGQPHLEQAQLDVYRRWNDMQPQQPSSGGLRTFE